MKGSKQTKTGVTTFVHEVRWMLGTFWKGYKKNLVLDDLYTPLDEHKSDMLGDSLEKNWNEEVANKERRKKRPRFLSALSKAFIWKFLIYGIIFGIIDTFSRIGQPIFLGQLIAYFTPDSKISLKSAYLNAGGVILCSALLTLINHPFVMATFHLGMKMKIACCSLIYRKALRLSQASFNETTVGQIVNLISNDVNHFDYLMGFAHDLWIGPLQTAIVAYFIWRDMGAPALIGLAALIMIIPIQGLLGHMTSKVRFKMAERTDERVRLMNEIISGIQVIKMYTWEKPFEKLVFMTRWNELKQIRNASVIKAIYNSFSLVTSRVAVFSTILAYVLSGNTITAEKVFVLTSFYNSLSRVMAIGFPEAIAQVANTSVSIKRIEKFLLHKEITLKSLDREDCTGVQLCDVTAKWTSNSLENTLSSISLNMKPGMLVAIIGPVGSGKSSLLHAILQELPLISGSIKANGNISYMSQVPWIFAGSVRQNITFINDYDAQRYNNVIEVCALRHDLEHFPYGDATLVGERGITLSGGQKARINLARAVYHQADVYLLDDPLSAVDTQVGNQLYAECISSYLSSKIRVLVTHQLQYMRGSDLIVILDKGKAVAMGSFDELQSSGVDFAKWLSHKSSEHEVEKETKINYLPFKPDDSLMEEILEKQKVDEKQARGTIEMYIFKKYFSAAGSCHFTLFIFILFAIAQLLGTACDYWITFWTNLEQSNQTASIHQNTTYPSSISLNLHRGTSSFISLNFPQKIDFDEKYLNQIFNRDICVYVYIGLISVMLLTVLLRSIIFFAACLKSSSTLHENMFKSLVNTTLRFFTLNPSGRILNRFSDDMGAIDEVLPQSLLDTLQTGFALVAVISLVSYVNYWLVIPAVFIVVVSYLLRMLYLATTSSLKRLEGIARSPVFSHLNASVQGLTTIRAFKAQNILKKQFDNHQDLHSSAFYILLAAGRTFGYWLDFLCLVYITVVTLSFLSFGSGAFGGNVGLAITQSAGLTGMFQWGMKQFVQLEIQMTAVERVTEYTNLKAELNSLSHHGQDVPNDWPSQGQIIFKNVSLKYDPNGPIILKNLNFVINPREKLGIVGRTGAGKSSLIAALFRLTEIEGSIEIDGVNCSTISLSDLRSRISIIPQDPVIFSGTLRKNLDPFDEHSDHHLWMALKEVELKETVSKLPGSLDSKISEGGSNFSVGQRQLICLARAIIRKNKILILDEATANVDPQTDAIIQRTIQEKVEHCTVITIAHRLHTIMDSERVLVMDRGEIVEIGKPSDLLKKKDGYLFNMVKQTGNAMAKDLHNMAEM